VDPLNVKQTDFPIDYVLYDDGDFSMVLGTWDGKKLIGVRWNNNFPTSHGHPVWLLLPEGELTINILKGVLGIKHANNDQIIDALKNLLPI
jgi:hypothetical protein